MHYSITAVIRKAKEQTQFDPVYCRALETFAEYFNPRVPNLKMGLYNGDPAFTGDCPFCERKGGFLANFLDGTWGCPGCMQEGNFVNFVQRIEPNPLSDEAATALANEIVRPVNEGGAR